MRLDRADRELLEHTLTLAREGMRALHGGPFGALVVRDGEVLAEACNAVTSENDPTAHAEVRAIRMACARLESFTLAGCALYASCEPCPMCLGAIHWARLDRLVYASTRQDAAAAGFDDGAIHEAVCGRGGRMPLRSERIEIASAAELFDEWRRMENATRY